MSTLERWMIDNEVAEKDADSDFGVEEIWCRLKSGSSGWIAFKHRITIIDSNVGLSVS